MDISEIKIILKAIAQSNPRGLPIKEFNERYQRTEGRSIEFSKYGYRTLEAFLKTLPDILTVETSLGNITIYPVFSENSRHLHKLISNQKTSSRHATRKSSKHFRAPSYNVSKNQSTEENKVLTDNNRANTPSCCTSYTSPEGTIRSQLNSTVTVTETKMYNRMANDSEKEAAIEKPSSLSYDRNEKSLFIKDSKEMESVNCTSNIVLEKQLNTTNSKEDECETQTKQYLGNKCKSDNNDKKSKLNEMKEFVAASSLFCSQNERIQFVKYLEEIVDDKSVNDNAVGECDQPCNTDFTEEIPDQIDAVNGPLPVRSVVIDNANEGELHEFQVSDELQINSIVEIFITEVINCDKFYFYILEDAQELFDLMDSIEMFYRKLSNNEFGIKKEDLRANDLCAVLFNNVWYRGKIKSIITDDVNGEQKCIISVHVILIDYGTVICVQLDDLKYLIKSFRIVKLRCQRASLAKRNGIEYWSAQSIKLFVKNITNCNVFAKPVSICRNTNRLKMILYCTQEHIELNRLLLE